MTSVPLLFGARGEEGQSCGQEGMKEFLLASGAVTLPRPQPQGLGNLRQVNIGRCLLGSAPRELAWTPNKASENRLGRAQLTCSC